MSRKFNIGQLVEYVGWEEINPDWVDRVGRVIRHTFDDSVEVEFLDNGETMSFLEYALQRYIPASRWEPKESK